MRVDDAPRLLRLPILLYGYAAAAALRSAFLAPRPTIRVRIQGGQRLQPTAPYIFCHWHEAISLLFQASVPRLPPALHGAPHAWMQHPLWHMKAIHLFLRGIGVEQIVLGSTGHDGRSAADALVRWVLAGYSTVVLPDGPAGPPRALKHGVLHIAAQSGAPIVPLRLSASRCVRLPTWDRKVYALPFATIRIAIGTPITVSTRSPEACAAQLIAALG